MAKQKVKRKASSTLNLRTRSEKITLAIFFVIFCAYALTLVVPMVWTAYSSLKDQRSFSADSFNFPGIYVECPACKDPEGMYTCADYAGMCKKEMSQFYAAQKNAGASDITAFFATAGKVVSNMFAEAIKWDNYSEIFDKSAMTVSIPFAIFNTVWRTVGSVSFNIFFCACTSYVVCKYAENHRWLNWVYAFVVTIMIIPVLGTTASSYNLMHNELQIANKPLLIWVTWCSGIGFGFLMLYSGWKNLSWSYAEAAFIDGASHFQVFWQVMFPMIKPVISALFIVNFISGWSEYMDTVLYMDQWPSLGYMAYFLQQRAMYFGMPLYFAVIMVAAIPTILVFIGFQETIMKNVTAGGLKG